MNGDPLFALRFLESKVFNSFVWGLEYLKVIWASLIGIALNFLVFGESLVSLLMNVVEI
jgi:hypothetical protein